MTTNSKTIRDVVEKCFWDSIHNEHNDPSHFFDQATQEIHAIVREKLEGLKNSDTNRNYNVALNKAIKLFE